MILAQISYHSDNCYYASYSIISSMLVTLLSTVKSFSFFQLHINIYISTYTWNTSCFIQWLIISYYYYLMLKLSQIWLRGVSLLICPHLLSDTRDSRLYLCFLSSSPEISHFSKKLWLLSVQNGIEKPRPGY